MGASCSPVPPTTAARKSNKGTKTDVERISGPPASADRRRGWADLCYESCPVMGEIMKMKLNLKVSKAGLMAAAALGAALLVGTGLIAQTPAAAPPTPGAKPKTAGESFKN